MKFLLVIQFTGDTVDYDKLIDIENILIEKLSDRCQIDGHDFGAGESNIFILTNDPISTFDEVKRMIINQNIAGFKAAYRELRGEKYNMLWPPTLKDFHII